MSFFYPLGGTNDPQKSLDHIYKFQENNSNSSNMSNLEAKNQEQSDEDFLGLTFLSKLYINHFKLILMNKKAPYISLFDNISKFLKSSKMYCTINVWFKENYFLIALLVVAILNLLFLLYSLSSAFSHLYMA